MITPDLPFRGVTQVLLEDGWHPIVPESLTAVSPGPNQPPTTFRWVEMVLNDATGVEDKMTFIAPASSLKALQGPWQDEPKVQVIPAGAMPSKPRRLS